MASENRIIIKDINKMRQAFRQSPEMAARAYINAVKLSAQLIKVEMKNQVPKKSRNLARSIQSSVQRLTGKIGPDLRTAPYAIFVHEGTRAHEIRPRYKQALWWEGAKHPVKLVRHPGISPNKFIPRTVDRVKRPVQEVFSKITDKLLQDIANKSQ